MIAPESGDIVIAGIRFHVSASLERELLGLVKGHLSATCQQFCSGKSSCIWLIAQVVYIFKWRRSRENKQKLRRGCLRPARPLALWTGHVVEYIGKHCQFQRIRVYERRLCRADRGILVLCPAGSLRGGITWKGLLCHVRLFCGLPQFVETLPTSQSMCNFDFCTSLIIPELPSQKQHPSKGTESRESCHYIALGYITSKAFWITSHDLHPEMLFRIKFSVLYAAVYGTLSLSCLPPMRSQPEKADISTPSKGL